MMRGCLGWDGGFSFWSSSVSRSSLVWVGGNVGWRMAVVLLVGRIFVTFVSSDIPGCCSLGLRADLLAGWSQGMLTINWIVSTVIIAEAILERN
jgi:hypothetical protein